MDGHEIKSIRWTDYPTGIITSYRDDSSSPKVDGNNSRACTRSGRTTDYVKIFYKSIKYAIHLKVMYNATKWTDPHSKPLTIDGERKSSRM